MISSSVNLNTEQQQAVDHFKGPCLVTAVPGSGKTSTLTSRVIKLIEKGVSPRAICCITFTNKAAQEMKERVRTLDPNARKVWVSTFHRLCVRILRKYGTEVGLKEGFSIYDDEDSNGVMTKVHRMWAATREENSTLEPHLRRLLLSRVDDLRESAKPFDLDNEDERLSMYLSELKTANAVDFSGMLHLTWKILSKNPEICANLTKRFQFVLVDEAQDTNDIQYAIARLIASHGNIFMVGDYQQSVYSFRGANPENLNKFLTDYPTAKNIVLPRNYRSRSEILEKARNVIVHNDDAANVQLVSERGAGGSVHIDSYDTEWEETENVVHLMRDYHNQGYKWSDIAVIYRLNKLSQAFEIGLSQAGIPYQTRGGQSFFSRREIKTSLAYLRLLTNPSDSTAFAQAISNPKRGIGDSLIGKIDILARDEDISVSEAAARVKARTKIARSGLDEFLALLDRKRADLRTDRSLMVIADELMKESGYHAQLCQDVEDEKEGPRSLMRLENMEKFVEGIGDFEEGGSKPTLEKFLQQIALVQDGDNKNPDSVSLLTMHAAKGLEFPVVFVVGANHEIVPHIKSVEENREPEERRLFYVALTRAKDQLRISFPIMRRKWNRMIEMGPSPYLRDMLDIE